MSELTERIARILCDLYEHKCCDECDVIRIDFNYSKYLDDAAAIVAELPQPIKPQPPEIEDLTAIPPQKHVWDRNWDADIHQGYFCAECNEMSDCELCNKDWASGDDCLIIQAEERNDKVMRSYGKAIERWQAQMDYWRELTADE